MEVDLGRGLRPDQWARFCGRHTCADVIENYARGRLMERTTSHKWYFDTIDPAQTTTNVKTKTGNIQGVDHNGNGGKKSIFFIFILFFLKTKNYFRKWILFKVS